MKSKFSNCKSLSELNDIDLFLVLCKGINNNEDMSNLMNLFKETTTKYSSIFDVEPFITIQDISEENPEGYNLLEYILPSVKRVYSKFFINLPGLFNNERLNLFKLQFNLEEFLLLLKEKFIKNKEVLNNFEYLDKNTEILTLIVDEYVASKVSYVSSINTTKIKEEIRDIKINKHLKI
jgi:hypothetical protein